MSTNAVRRDLKRALQSAGCSFVQFLSHPDCRVEHIRLIGGRDPEYGPLRFLDAGIWGATELHVGLEILPELEQHGECIMHAIGASSTCRKLTFDYVSFSPDQLSQLCDGLVSNQALEYLRIFSVSMDDSSADAAYDDNLVAKFPPVLKILLAALEGNESLRGVEFSGVDLGSRPGSLEPNGLVSALSRENCKIESLHIVQCEGLSHDVLTSVATCLGKTNKSVKHFTIGQSSEKRGQPLPDEFGNMLRSNTTLVHLVLRDFSLSNSQFIQFFKLLEDNASLEHLTLDGFQGFEGDEVIAHLLDSLQVNGILQFLYIESPSPFSSRSEAAIEAQLARNRKFGDTIKKLKESQPAEKVSPTTSRLFICGEPYAGKSNLAVSLAKTAQTRRKSGRYFTSFSREHMYTKRTRGIQITSLSKDTLNISIWDLAGQHEFHSLHDHMFPDFTNQGSPSFFLFVWNPFKMSPNGHELIQRKSRNTFTLEFKYWLKFIVSKTRRSNVLKPRLIVVLSRKDRMADGESIESWLGDYLTNVKSFFNGVIDVKRVFEVDARDPISVKDVYSYIFETAGEILRSGVPPEYVQCQQVRKHLSDRLRKDTPLITFAKFGTWCGQLGILSSDLHEAIALSLNNSGDLIYLKCMNFVVIDMHWFCFKVMGNLIYYSGPTEKGSGGNAEQGFFSLAYLKSLLEREAKATSNDRIRFFNRRQRRSLVEGGDLVKLFLGLHLACRKDFEREDSEIFIPACLPASENSESRWRQNIGDERGNPVVFLGRRLKCQDSGLTFITPGVFHFLQVSTFMLNNQSWKFLSSSNSQSSNDSPLIRSLVTFVTFHSMVWFAGVLA